MEGAVTATLLRRGLIALSSMAVVATAIELAAERHWKPGVQLIPWVALAILAAVILLLTMRPGLGSIRAARLLLLAVLISTGVGIWEHIYSNYDSAPLDYRYTDTWDGLSGPEQWWLAITKTVGPSPPLAPAALAYAALSLLLATVRHPALGYLDDIDGSGNPDPA